ncbi:MAG: hypothetical protein ABI700_13240 [Chloroflexota bacterium]
MPFFVAPLPKRREALFDSPTIIYHMYQGVEQMNKCAICGKQVRYTLVCKACHSGFDLSAAWAKMLLSIEKDWRNANRREERAGFDCLSDCVMTDETGRIIDGWDMLDSRVEGSIVGGLDGYSLGYDENHTVLEAYRQLRLMASDFRLTAKEMMALTTKLFTYDDATYTSKEAAEYISKMEGEPVKAAAYRRRLTEGRKKLISEKERLQKRWLRLPPEEWPFEDDDFETEDEERKPSRAEHFFIKTWKRRPRPAFATLPLTTP